VGNEGKGRFGGQRLMRFRKELFQGAWEIANVRDARRGETDVTPGKRFF